MGTVVAEVPDYPRGTFGQCNIADDAYNTQGTRTWDVYPGRELALDLGTGIYRPAICAHSPGVAHKVADALSRRYAPAFEYELPTCLAAALEVSVGPREASYYRSLEL